MKIKIKGELSLPEVRQALFELLAMLEDEYRVRYAYGATLYLTPTNGFGEEVVPVTQSGREVTSLDSDGPYRSLAAEYRL